MKTNFYISNKYQIKNYIFKNGIKADLYIESKRNSFLVILISFSKEEGEKVISLFNNLSYSLSFLNIYDFNWNDDLTPRYSEKIFNKGQGFKGNADNFLKFIINEVLSIIEKEMNPVIKIIAGYSLGGLFSLYSAYKCNEFNKVICASGSLWYPNLVNFIKENQISNNVKDVYFSLGDKEKYTSNRYMKNVYDNTLDIFNNIKEKGINTIFELNKGNHFVDNDIRVFKGIEWCIKQK